MSCTGMHDSPAKMLDPRILETLVVRYALPLVPGPRVVPNAAIQGPREVWCARLLHTWQQWIELLHTRQQ